jgi:hypothetical protein
MRRVQDLPEFVLNLLKSFRFLYRKLPFLDKYHTPDFLESQTVSHQIDS